MSGRIDPKLLEPYNEVNCPFQEEPTLEELIKYYLEHIVKIERVANTYTNYRSIAHCHVITMIGAYKVSELTSSIFQYYFDEKEKSGRVDGKGGLGPKTLREHFNFINLVIKKAMEWKLMDFNPCSGIKLPKVIRAEIKTLSVKEQQLLNQSLDATYQSNSILPIFLANKMGFRIGEICALKTNDINLENKTIRIDESLSRVGEGKEDDLKYVLKYGTTKSKRTRIVPMSKEVYCSLSRYLETMPKEMKEHQDEALFVNSLGRVIEPRLLNYHFRKCCEQLKIEGIHFHSLRHTFATRALEAGMEMNTLSKILGHANTSITQDIYVHVTESKMHQEMAKLDCFDTPSL